MKNFIYYAPTKVFFGKNTENQLGEIVKSYGFKTVMVHYGMESVKKSGLLDNVLQQLIKEGISYIEFGGVEPNPKLTKVHTGVALAKENQVDFILAIGGGSVLDSAKLIAAGAKTNLDPWEFSAKRALVEDALPVGVILTLSAAGSEMSSSSVITHEALQKKTGFNSDWNRPLFAIMNPELTYSVSKYQTACGIVDIMMHTLERYFSSVEYTPLTDDIALTLLKNVVDAGKKAYQNPKDYEARAILMWASSLSHNGLTGTFKDLYMPVHQLEHELSGLHDEVAHGAGLSILFIAWAKYFLPEIEAKMAKFGEVVFGIKGNNKAVRAKQAIEALSLFYQSIQMPTKLRDLNIPGIDVDALAKAPFDNTRQEIPALQPIDEKKAKDIFIMAF